MNLFFPHGNRVLQSPMHALAAEQSDAEAEERAGLRPWRMGAVGCMAAKAPGRARRKGSNGRDGLASCMATTRRKRKPHGQRRVAQCERFNCSCGKQSRSDVIPLLSFHMQTNGGCAALLGATRPPARPVAVTASAGRADGVTGSQADLRPGRISEIGPDRADRRGLTVRKKR